jgi:hypothetical protein
MASVFDINHPLHNVAGVIGVLTIPVAAPLISVALTRSPPWSAARKLLLWTSNLIWISLVLFIVTTVILAITYLHTGAQMTSPVMQLPPGVIALNGWPNRFFVVACSVWVWRSLDKRYEYREGKRKANKAHHLNSNSPCQISPEPRSPYSNKSSRKPTYLRAVLSDNW